MIFGRELILGHKTERLFQAPASGLTATALKALCLQLSFAGGADDDGDCFQVTPPATWMVNLIEPLSSGCSSIVCPWRLASILAFSTA